MTRSEEILSKESGCPIGYIQEDTEGCRISPSYALSAMQQVAVEFAEWLDKNCYMTDTTGLWFNYKTASMGGEGFGAYLSTGQLFEIFNQKDGI